MTIGIGFLCKDGVVLGADTEESYEETKTSVNKIEIIKKAFCHSGIVASGTSYIIEYIVSEIRTLLESDWQNNMNIEAQLKHLMPKLYQGEAMQAFPVEKVEDKHCNVLVACRPQGKRAALFQINSTLVTRISAAALVGCGPLRDVADEFSKFSMTVDRAAWAALYVVYLAKERWTGIGGVSHILKIWNDGALEDERTWDQGRREKFFESYRFLNHLMLLETADIQSKEEAFNHKAKILVTHLRDMRKQLRDIEFQHRKYKHKVELNQELTKAMFDEWIESKRKRNNN